MKRGIRTLAFTGLAIYLSLTFSGCASMRPAENREAVPEPVSTYVVLVYELPFVYEKGKPRQETFLSVIRKVVAPADWEQGPDSMTAIANILVVSTTAQNHMRLERFFDSLPDLPEQQPKGWLKPPKKTEESE